MYQNLRGLLLTLMGAAVMTGCSKQNGKFVLHQPDETGIDFVNSVQESDSINIFDFENIYNGGGVGVGDFNNDSLQDLYFTGNMVPNKLYLNKGQFRFEDITTASRTEGKGVWSRGVAVIDINNDGWQDMYVCATAYAQPERRRNILYINKGLNAKGIPEFEDQAAAYGLADTTQTTMAYFFDYDRDGDLDVYLGVNHIMEDDYPNVFTTRSTDGTHPSCGKLYRNDYDSSRGHALFTDVSKAAGIGNEGYTHAVNIFDANNDGWPDIMEANDYISNNVLYINNRDGTFTDKVTEYFKHTAANSMGSDAIDLNNDGWEDVIEVDMAPQDNFRKKMFMQPVNYTTYINSQMFDYQLQYVRNMVQANMGPTVGQADSIGHPVFGDIGYFSGIAETDWSWTPLVADYDNDGLRDIVFTNGFRKDITDHDFATYRQTAYQLTPKKEMLQEIPEVKIHNYAYRNTGGFRFEEKTFDWGFEEPSYSNGAAYADLDNDGDLDVVINNIDHPAHVYENRLATPEAPARHLQLVLQGPAANRGGIGTRITVYQPGRVQSLVHNPYRGYISSISPVVHFGLGAEAVDSVVVQWPDGHRQLLRQPAASQRLTISYQQAAPAGPAAAPALLASQAWLTNITAASGISYQHWQRDFIDFNIQKLLPHKLSEYSPALAAGDINGDGLDDMVVGAAPGRSTTLLLQQPDGRFVQRSLMDSVTASYKTQDERGLLLFDADNDNDLDLMIAAGGYSYQPDDSAFADLLYTNDGRGHFTRQPQALPHNNTSKLCVRAADIDHDGDLDLFVSGRVKPYFYPQAVSSFVYRNESANGVVRFTDATAAMAPALQNLGLTCDALFTDYDNDGWTDLLLAGEWMPLTLLKNQQGKLAPVANTGLDAYKGWWNSLLAADFDADGDMDYVAGNLGYNSYFRGSSQYPLRIRAADFDNNGSYDAIPSLYLKNTLEKDAVMDEFPAHGRDDLVKQMISMRNRFPKYETLARANMDSVVNATMRKQALTLEANMLASAYIRNDGQGRFSLQPLPDVVQYSAINGMVAADLNGDGHTDLMLNTNDYSADPNVGRYNALNGLMLQGDGRGGFTPLTMLQSGVTITGNGKGMAMLQGARGGYLVAAAQNRGPLQVFAPRHSGRVLRWMPGDAYALITLADGRKQRIEAGWGHAFLSQNSRLLVLPAGATGGQVVQTNGQQRLIVP